jgi:hypothetical protein
MFILLAGIRIRNTKYLDYADGNHRLVPLSVKRQLNVPGIQNAVADTASLTWTAACEISGFHDGVCEGDGQPFGMLHRVDS